jgi:hypothetical protein
MRADLDTLCTTVYCTADDLLPERPGNARRRVTDAEVATLCVAQAIMGIPSDRRFLSVARKRLHHLFPELPQQPGFHKRRARLVETVEWLIGIFATRSPGYYDDLLLIDSTPVECARSVETTRRSAPLERTSPTVPSKSSLRFASGSSRSSGPARTSSPWSATAPALSSTCALASPSECWRSLPALRSTTGWGVRVVLWSTTSPEAWNQPSRGCGGRWRAASP